MSDRYAICKLHNLSFQPNVGGFCPYCKIKELEYKRTVLALNREGLNDMILKLVTMADKMKEEGINNGTLYIDIEDGNWGFEATGK